MMPVKSWVLSRWTGKGWQRMGRFDSFRNALQVGSGYARVMKRRGACGEIAISQDIPDLAYYTQAIEALGDRFFLSANAEERADLRVEISNLVSRMVQFCEEYNLCKLKPVDRSKYYDPMPEYLRIQGEEFTRISLEVANARAS
jgi:hypothetical protein